MELNGNIYYALIPYNTDDEEYIILRASEDDGDLQFSTVDDDEEFDRVVDAFEDQFFDEVDYDVAGESSEDK